MSFFTELAETATEVHEEYLGDDYEYRATSSDDWSEITARIYNERTENRKTAHGWNRVALTDISVSLAFIEQPILHSQFREPDSEIILTVIEFFRLRSDRWVLTCQQTKAGEISRPNLRRN